MILRCNYSEQPEALAAAYPTSMMWDAAPARGGRMKALEFRHSAHRAKHDLISRMRNICSEARGF